VNILEISIPRASTIWLSSVPALIIDPSFVFTINSQIPIARNVVIPKIKRRYLGKSIKPRSIDPKNSFGVPKGLPIGE
jgi:hypothetical protein